MGAGVYFYIKIVKYDKLIFLSKRKWNKMKQTFFDWNLTKSVPCHCRLSCTPKYLKYENTVSDFHEALHLNIQFAGESRKKIGTQLLSFDNITCMLTAPWEPHKTAFSSTGSLLLMTVIDCSRLTDSLPGYEEKLHKVLLLPPEERHQLIKKHISDDFLLDIVKELYTEEVVENMLRDFKYGIHSFKKYSKLSSPLEDLEKWYVLLRFFVRLLTKTGNAEFTNTHTSAYEELIPAYRLIAENPNRRVTADEGAVVCNMGISAFRKLFRTVTGCAFAEYELSCRFRNAVAELMEGRMVIKELTEKYDFYDVSHFIRIFRKKYSMSPMRYMREKKKMDEENQGKA